MVYNKTAYIIQLKNLRLTGMAIEIARKNAVIRKKPAAFSNSLANSLAWSSDWELMRLATSRVEKESITVRESK